jgi:hypothetical protein
MGESLKFEMLNLKSSLLLPPYLTVIDQTGRSGLLKFSKHADAQSPLYSLRVN